MNPALIISPCCFKGKCDFRDCASNCCVDSSLRC